MLRLDATDFEWALFLFFILFDEHSVFAVGKLHPSEWPNQIALKHQKTSAPSPVLCRLHLFSPFYSSPPGLKASFPSHSCALFSSIDGFYPSLLGRPRARRTGVLRDFDLLSIFFWFPKPYNPPSLLPTGYALLLDPSWHRLFTLVHVFENVLRPDGATSFPLFLVLSLLPLSAPPAGNIFHCSSSTVPCLPPRFCFSRPDTPTEDHLNSLLIIHARGVGLISLLSLFLLLIPSSCFLAPLFLSRHPYFPKRPLYTVVRCGLLSPAVSLP